jgi:hypothetical protein
MDSPAAPVIPVSVTVTDAVSPARIDTLFADKVNESELATGAAEDGPDERTPSPSVATTTSAIRLKVIFDICFLSFVVKKTFFFTAGKENLFAS